MHHIPNEIILQICAFVKSDSPADLSSLRLTNWAWHNAATPFLYQSLRVKFQDVDSLKEAVSELREDGLGRHYLNHARRLDIVCLDNHFWVTTKRARRLWKQKDWELEYGYYVSRACEDTFLHHYLTEFRHPMLELLNDPIRFYHKRDWEPVASLLGRINRLDDVNFVVDNSFPKSLHQAIVEYHPTCRLNIWSYESLHLDRRGLGRPHISRAFSDEYNPLFAVDLLQTVGLHTLAFNYSTVMDEVDETKYTHFDELFPFVSMAPNLKHLVVRDTVATQYRLNTVKREWQQLMAIHKPVSVACLDSLTLEYNGFRKPPEETLLRLGAAVDLSRLRSLDISLHREPALLVQAASRMMCLERLFLIMEPHTNGGTDTRPYHEEMVAAVLALAPLKFLCLRGLRSASSLQTIVSRHGPSLQGLALEAIQESLGRDLYSGRYKYPILDQQHIAELAKSCPNLQELRLPVQRQGGSPQECQLYKALGQFPHLHTLILDLHCDSRPLAPESSPYDEPNIIDTDHIRQKFFNAATDEKLARGIWDLVWSSQSSRKLKSLRVDHFGADLFTRQERHIIYQLSRSFLVSRPDFYPLESLEVQEIGKGVWDVLREYDVYVYGKLQMPQWILQILNELWPHPQGFRSRHLNGFWTSFPLQVDEVAGLQS